LPLYSLLVSEVFRKETRRNFHSLSSPCSWNIHLKRTNPKNTQPCLKGSPWQDSCVFAKVHG